MSKNRFNDGSTNRSNIISHDLNSVWITLLTTNVKFHDSGKISMPSNAVSVAISCAYEKEKENYPDCQHLDWTLFDDNLTFSPLRSTQYFRAPSRTLTTEIFIDDEILPMLEYKSLPDNKNIMDLSDFKALPVWTSEYTVKFIITPRVIVRCKEKTIGLIMKVRTIHFVSGSSSQHPSCGVIIPDRD
jgi:hypothetical protein